MQPFLGQLEDSKLNLVLDKIMRRLNILNQGVQKVARIISQMSAVDLCAHRQSKGMQRRIGLRHREYDALACDACYLTNRRIIVHMLQYIECNRRIKGAVIKWQPLAEISQYESPRKPLLSMDIENILVR